MNHVVYIIKGVNFHTEDQTYSGVKKLTQNG